ncbi:MAG: ABC transporter ATP-binding protein [Lachnospiraceae bacterium]
MGEFVLECRKVGKSFGKNEVLKDLDLTIESGKIYGLIGRNGAGKTTLLSVMTAQNKTSEGEVLLNGEPIWENEKALRNICFSRELTMDRQSGILGMKVKDYLRTAKIYYPQWDRDMADHLVKEFGLELKKPLVKLSKGMLSMVTIIVALASKAPITILDEPVAGLDIFARKKFYQILLEEYSKTGRTFIISTHIIEEAADVLEEVMIIKDGRIVIKENTQDLVDRAFHVSGLEGEVDRAVKGLTVYSAEKTGRGKGVTVLLNAGESIDTSADVTVQPIHLSEVFLAVCSGN